MEGVIAGWYAKKPALISRHFALWRSALPIASPPRPGSSRSPRARIPRDRAGPARTLRDHGLGYQPCFRRHRGQSAAKAGVAADFRIGNAAAMPFADNSFDFIVCRAAFKNFQEPARALGEMHRVLKPGGQALIIDMRRDASNAAIDCEVRGMNLSGVGRLMN